MKQALFLLCASTLVVSCASRDPAMAGNVGSAAGGAMAATGAGLASAALSPLDDLNLRRKDIPDSIESFETPYDLAPALSCDSIARSVLRLDAVLGADYDVEDEDPRLRSERWASQASTAALDAVADQARSFIPFRGLVRRATGADKADKEYREAFVVAAQRRSFLKGIGLALNCAAPAAPIADPERDTPLVVFDPDQGVRARRMLVQPNDAVPMATAETPTYSDGVPPLLEPGD